MKKGLKRFLRRFTKKEFLYKVLIIVSSLALIATTVLPYIVK